jgi:hypothetical protein
MRSGAAQVDPERPMGVEAPFPLKFIAVTSRPPLPWLVGG